ncbi:siderophore ABC transporter substrate-binding protein [Affinibrenneria salicis]|uniref:Siderophore ABC transporter substrate-binding protein n=1 Tax=Affinibrenneria salicis TaxID=2590031 RepID=A0A5J5G492_9GAMM|nr:siderophore ABC transporter substrate-binding protein [Affinibrenneria salicis]KAA9001840.1 siderophore ABC transporter substrate-binding protein [Affinibrenneria salicis]
MRLASIVKTVLLTSALAGVACAVQAEGAQTLSIEHAQGTTVVPLNPKKVIVLNPSLLDTMDALKIDIAGVPQTNTHLPAFLAKYSGKEYLNAGTLFEPDYEKLSSASPDLIIAGGRAHDAYDKLSAIAPTIALDVDGNNFYPSLVQRTQQLAAIFGKQQEAKAQLDAFKQHIDQINGKAVNAGSAMVLMISGGKISAHGPKSRFGFIFDELGFKPAKVFPETGRHGNVVSSELLMSINPEWLFIVDRDSAIGRSGGEAAQQVLDNPLVHKTAAWQKKHIVYLDSTALYIAGGLQSYTRMMETINQALDQQTPAAQ